MHLLSVIGCICVTQNGFQNPKNEMSDMPLPNRGEKVG